MPYGNAPVDCGSDFRDLPRFTYRVHLFTVGKIIYLGIERICLRDLTTEKHTKGLLFDRTLGVIEIPCFLPFND